MVIVMVAAKYSPWHCGCGVSTSVIESTRLLADVLEQSNFDDSTGSAPRRLTEVDMKRLYCPLIMERARAECGKSE